MAEVLARARNVIQRKTVQFAKDHFQNLRRHRLERVEVLLLVRLLLLLLLLRRDVTVELDAKGIELIIEDNATGIRARSQWADDEGTTQSADTCLG